MKRLLITGLAVLTLFGLSGALAPSAHAGDSGAGGGGTATFVAVPFIAVYASTSGIPSLLFTDPSGPPPGYGEAPCTAVADQPNVGDVAIVTCLAGPGGSLGQVQYVALISGQGGADGNKLVTEANQVMADVTAKNNTAICTDINTFEKTVFSQKDGSSQNHLKYYSAADLLWGAELWANFHNCPLPTDS